MSKYIIKNCPARLSKSGLCIEAPEKKAYLCQDCTDCIMKQIVDKCNKIIFLNGNIDYKEGFSNLAVSENFVARQILHLLNIQEVE